MKRYRAKHSSRSENKGRDFSLAEKRERATREGVMTRSIEGMVSRVKVWIYNVLMELGEGDEDKEKGLTRGVR